MSFEVDFSNLEHKLRDIGNLASRKTLDEAITEGEKPVIKAMGENVPYDTGELSENLGEIDRYGSGLNRTGRVGINTKDRDIVLRGVYTEYGTRHIVAQKWMKRSFIQAETKAKEAIKKSLKESLKL